MANARTRWDGDFAGNEAGYPINHNPYLAERGEAPVPAADLAWMQRPDMPPPLPPPSSGYSVTNPKMASSIRNMVTLQDALDLLIDLWPKPGYQTVTIETHQWIKLRRILLEIPRLVAADE